MSNRLLLIVAALLIANMGIAVWTKSASNMPSGTTAPDGAIALVRPWFIDEALASDDRSARAIINIANEAGVSAYVKTPSTITLALATTAFTSVTTNDSNYVMGVIIPAGYSAYWGVQVLVHKSGWIMAWYHKDWLAATVVNVNDKTFANNTKLSLAIDKVTTTLKIKNIIPTYYHFKYPDANRLLIARKSLISGYMMRVGYPSALTYYDASGYYEYDTEVSGFDWDKCSTKYEYYSSGDNDWSNKYIGLFLNGQKIIDQTLAFPEDNSQYVDFKLDMLADTMNEFTFDARAGNLNDSKAITFSPRRCQTMAVVIVYKG
jgi:archaellin